jgi:hypothetical protein
LGQGGAKDSAGNGEETVIERVYIPTIRRAANQITYNHLPDEWQKRVIMVVDPAERHLYNYDCQYLEIPQAIVGIWKQLAETRLFIHKHAGSIKYAMVDDDLSFKRRNAKYWTGKSNMPTSIRDATPEEVVTMFATFGKWLDEPDIGVVGCSECHVPPPNTEYADTKGIFSFVAYDGRMLSKVIDDMDLTSIRVPEDVIFMYEALSRGINSRMATEWIFDNKSQNTKDLKGTRAFWEDPFDEKRVFVVDDQVDRPGVVTRRNGRYGTEQPEDHFQTDLHYDGLKYIQKKWPHGMKLYERNGRRKNTKYWKKVYKPKRRVAGNYYERLKARADSSDG